MLQSELSAILPFPLSSCIADDSEFDLDLDLDFDLPDLRPTTASTSASADVDVDIGTGAGTDALGRDRDWVALFTMPLTPPGANIDNVTGAGVSCTLPLDHHTTSPDDIFSSNWNAHTTLNNNSSSRSSSSAILYSKMPGGAAIGSSNSSPVDFAFEAPVLGASDKNQYHFTPTSTGQYPPAYGSYSTGSSFSYSTSGSIGGASFSSIDALPAISRDFVRPTPGETRRPVTAGGALQGRSPLNNVFPQRKDTIEEEMFTNPFAGTDNRPRHSEGVDPRYVPSQNRRASEGGQFHMPPPAWPPQPHDNGVAAQQATPSHAHAQYPYYSNGNGNGNGNTTPFRSSQLVNRPQTSDGLPSFGGQQALPSARSVVGSVDGFTPLSGLQPAVHIRSSYDDGMSYRDRPSSASALLDPRGDLQFVPIGGPAPRKRPRRRYDEIERLYLCGWSGCEKSYGTLNHLNAHVAMQKHGEKRLPSEFKDMRKAWRKRKREQAAAAANGSGQYGSWGRNSLSSGSEYDRRDSTMSGYSAGSRYPEDGSVYSYDSRPNTASSVGSSIDSRPFAAPAQSSMPGSAGPSAGAGAGAPGYPYSTYGGPQQPQQMQHSMAPHQYATARRDSAPQHIPLPVSSHGMGFRAGDDGPTPTQQNPFPIANNSAPPRAMHGAGAGSAAAGGPSGSGVNGGFPFQTLTQPMPMGGASQYSQFAFQR